MRLVDMRQDKSKIESKIKTFEAEPHFPVVNEKTVVPQDSLA